MPIPKNYKTKEAAAYIDVSPDTLDVLARGGHIVRFKIGGSWRYNEKDLDEYVRQQRQKGEAMAAQARAAKPYVPKMRPYDRKATTVDDIMKIFDQTMKAAGAKR